MPRVTVAHPEVRQLADEDDYNGWLQASQTVDVRARVRGHIEKIDFKDGDMVKKGQLLIEIDSATVQNRAGRGPCPEEGAGGARRTPPIRTWPAPKSC